MTLHDVDAFLTGGAAQTGDAWTALTVAAAFAADASQTADAGLALPAISSLSGDGSMGSVLGFLFDVNSSLSGDASVTADAGAAYAVGAAFNGDTTLASDLFLVIGLNAALDGSADYNASMVAFLSAILAASGSGFTVGELMFLFWSNLQGGGSFLQANVTWTPHPGSPPGPPAINAGATLQQFIDATGSNRKRTKTTVANSSSVDSNPVRKPFKPK